MKLFTFSTLILFLLSSHVLADMRIELTSIFVDDQKKALEFYTKIGFKKKTDQMHANSRWLTVVSPTNTKMELSLEPNKTQLTKAYQKGKYDSGIPSMGFATSNLQKEYERLVKLKVKFKQRPTDVNGTKLAIFDDENGNYILLYEVNR